LWASLRALPRAAWILFFGTFLNKFGAFVMPFLTLYLTQQGYTLSQTGIAVGAYGAGQLAATLLGGIMADRFGRRRTIVLSMFSGAAAMLLLSQAHGLMFIVGLVALTGLTGELYRPAGSALLTDLVPSGQRVTAFAALRLAFNAGFAFGPAAAGFLAVFGYFWLFVGDAGTSVLYGLVALLALPQGVRSGPQGAGWGEAWRVLRRDRKLHQVLLSNFTMAVVYLQMASTFALYVTHLGFSPAVYGAIISFNGLLVVCCELPLTTFTRRFAARRMMATGYLLIGLGYALLYLAHTIPALVACMVVITLGEMVTMPMASAYVADLAPAHMRGRYLGVSGMTWAAALVVGPALGMKVFEISPTALWLGCGVLCVLAAVVISMPLNSSARRED